MAEKVQSKGTMFPEEVVADLFSKVTGKSSLAALCTQIPVAFNGNDIFVFSMDNEANIIGENEAAAGGEVTVAPVKMTELDCVSCVSPAGDYPAFDTKNKRHRYQAVYNLSHYPAYGDDADANIAMREACACLSYTKREGQNLTFTCLEDKPGVDIAVIVEVYV